MNQDDIVLSEIGQSQKDLNEVSKMVIFIESKSRMVVSRGEGEMGVANQTGIVSVQQDE